MEKRIIDIITEILKLDNNMLMAHFNDNTIWDSLQRIEVIFAMEDEFDFRFDEEELALLTTPKGLYEAILKREA